MAIPEDSLTLALDEQLKLIHELHELKLKFTSNNEKLNKLRTYLKEL